MPTEAESELLQKLAHTSAEIRRLGARVGEGFREAEADLCRRIRKQRLASGMSQGEVAETMTEFGFDMQQSTVAKVEAGTRALRVAELFGLATALNVPVLSLLFDPAGGYIEGSVGAPTEALENFLAEEEKSKRRAQTKMMAELERWAGKYAVHDARAVLLASQIRQNGADALREQRAAGDEPTA